MRRVGILVASLDRQASLESRHNLLLGLDATSSLILGDKDFW